MNVCLEEKIGCLLSYITVMIDGKWDKSAFFCTKSMVSSFEVLLDAGWSLRWNFLCSYVAWCFCRAADTAAYVVMVEVVLCGGMMVTSIRVVRCGSLDV